MIFINTLRKRRLKFKPKLSTSLRAHGKWGDLLACIIPVSWCLNILINSNFLLKLIEWQNESSLFTLRIRGKQWYWVYKLDFKNFTNIITAPKNVGHNKWVLYTGNNVRQSDDYLSSLQLRKQVQLVKEYWKEVISKEDWDSKPKNSTLHNIVTNKINKNISILKYQNTIFNYKTSLNLPNNLPSLPLFKSKFNTVLLSSNSSLYNINTGKFYKKLDLNMLYSYDTSFIEGFMSSDTIKSSSSYFDETNRFSRVRQNQEFIGLRKIFINDDVIKNYINKQSDSVLKPLAIDFCNVSDRIESKVKPHNNFMVMKQKRYKRRKLLKQFDINIPKKSLDYFIKNDTNIPKKAKFLLEKNSAKFITKDLSNKYKIFMKNKIRSDNSNIVVNRRMLRTKRTLVIPAHVNITAITNSYDVIHSWFIPGLGLKMDCIPGRSTHHTFYVDNVGFYYGQCAEVCGRYHHHMPIRICALPFDHFLLWWHHFGAPKFIPNNFSKKTSIDYGLRKYSW
jgi:heme/copper-type cytochrome/quinol oxidase subunit 2